MRRRNSSATFHRSGRANAIFNYELLQFLGTDRED